MKICFAILLFLAGCSSPLLRLSYQSLGYVRLAKIHPSEKTQQCLTAAVSSAKAVQAFLEAQTLAPFVGTTQAIEIYRLKAQQAYLAMKTACQSFGTPSQAEVFGKQPKENAYVASPQNPF